MSSLKSISVTPLVLIKALFIWYMLYRKKLFLTVANIIWRMRNNKFYHFFSIIYFKKSKIYTEGYQNKIKLTKNETFIVSPLRNLTFFHGLILF
jgi:hypothetical protein